MSKLIMGNDRGLVESLLPEHMLRMIIANTERAMQSLNVCVKCQKLVEAPSHTELQQNWRQLQQDRIQRTSTGTDVTLKIDLTQRS